MVKIRLRRMGAHKSPYYRIVVADAPETENLLRRLARTIRSQSRPPSPLMLKKQQNGSKRAHSRQKR